MCVQLNTKITVHTQLSTLKYVNSTTLQYCLNNHYITQVHNFELCMPTVTLLHNYSIKTYKHVISKFIAL